MNFLPKPSNYPILLRPADAIKRTEREERSALASGLEFLTPCEREVMALVVRGLLNKPIIYEFGLNKRTIKIRPSRGNGRRCRCNLLPPGARLSETPPSALSW